MFKMIELVLDWEYSESMYIGFPMPTCLEIFPFWAIKLYFFSDTGLKEGWKFRRDHFQSNLLPHLKICSRYKPWENENLQVIDTH